MRGMTPELVAGVAVQIHALREWRVHAAHEDRRDHYRLALRDGRERQDVLIVLDGMFPFVACREAAPAPRAPTPLARRLRSILEGARLGGATAVPGERALVLRFRGRSGDHALHVELFGRHANWYLVDAGERVALTPRGDVAKRRGASESMPFVPVEPRGCAPPAPDASAATLRLAAIARDGDTLERVRTQVRRRLKRLEARTRKRIRGFEVMAARDGEAEDHQRRGELLRGAFHLLRPGQKVVRVPDYTVDPPDEVEVRVNPDLAPGEQVAACFRAARKCRRAAQEGRERLPAARDMLERLGAALAEIEEAADGDAIRKVLDARALPEVSVEISAAGSGRQPARARPWHAFVSCEGWRILVGKHARGNDELTLKQARPHDLFLHVRGASGSHVIVPTDRGKSVPKETLLDAAELACHFSERRASERNEVDYVERRYVRKPRGSPPGLVRLERARTLGVRRDDDRRTRLLASQAPPRRT